MEALRAAIASLEAENKAFIDPRELSALIDRMQVVLSGVLQRGIERGEHQLAGLRPASWAARTCGISKRAAGDRLCVGKHIDALPETAAALAATEIGYQAASAICHLREDLEEKWPAGLESELVGFARRFSVEHFRFTCKHARHVIDPDGFDTAIKEDFERRWLEISPLLDGMFSVDGVLDQVTGAAFRTALEALAKPRGPEDTRGRGQRMADALAELLEHEMNVGRLPRRRGVRPHITVTTTLQGLKDQVGQPAAELECGVQISNQTVERLSCDCTMSRVLLADSMVIDVGRATRTIQPALRRAVQRRDRGCRWPGCDRPVSWSTPHHIEFWSRGGSTNLSNLVLLCHYHHRLVHEEGWRVVKVGEQLRFLPPEHMRTRCARGPDLSWVA